jgi:tRNA1Val (adenine37-N6)-methyltransferase
MKDLFHFKQFSVNQSGCGMKINTDGVLLGALARSENPSSILDIGTGTGVIAMMLAQRFPGASVDAVEIDVQAAETARKNFMESNFSSRLKSFQNSFQDFSQSYPDKKYDLIVSNPPFFTNSLKNPDPQKHLARHTVEGLFYDLIQFAKNHLSASGTCYFILPPDAATQVLNEGSRHSLKAQSIINVKSSSSKPAHRQIIGLGFEGYETSIDDFVIYQSEKVYSSQYELALKDFFVIF